MKCRLNLKSNPISFSIIAASGKEHKFLEKLGDGYFLELKSGDVSNCNICGEPIQPSVSVEEIATFLHNSYERIAIEVGWKTQESCQVCFDDLPEKNKLVMLKTATALLETYDIKRRER